MPSAWGGRVAWIALGGHLGHVNATLDPDDLHLHVEAVRAPGVTHEPLNAVDGVQHWAGAVFAGQELP